MVKMSRPKYIAGVLRSLDALVGDLGLFQTCLVILLNKQYEFDKVEYNEEDYCQLYPDVARLDCPKLHYIAYGIRERRIGSHAKNDYYLLKHSSLFDAKYYLSRNSDVRANRYDPVKHFLLYGWKEGRDPSASFSVSEYLEVNADVKKAGINPLIHFLKSGISENRHTNKYQPIVQVAKDAGLFDSKYYLQNNPDVEKSGMPADIHFFAYGYKEFRDPSSKFCMKKYAKYYDILNENCLIHYLDHPDNKAFPVGGISHSISSDFELLFDFSPDDSVTSGVDIILPVYVKDEHGLDLLRKCISSLSKTVRECDRVIIINDNSMMGKDVDALILQEEVVIGAEIKYIKNDTNIGFVRTCNKAFEMVDSDCVIVNMDTELPEFWIERIFFPLRNDRTIATVTPITNAGTIASFPITCVDNALVGNRSFVEIDSVFIRRKQNVYEVPTGVGFCMAISYHALRKVGEFDAESFGKGYGEENDFCMRAKNAGYKNVIINNLFVYHKHGGSFGKEDKSILMKENARVLDIKHPGYAVEIKDYIENKASILLDNFLTFCLLVEEISKTNIHLFLDHGLGGGATDFARDYTDKIKMTPHIVMTYSADENNYKLVCRYDGSTCEVNIDNIGSVIVICKLLKISKCVINNIVTYDKKDVLDLLSWMHIEKVFVHDYFFVCPRYTLIAKNGNCCYGRTLNCSTCMGEAFISDWRSSWASVLRLADKVVVFSSDSKNILNQVFGAGTFKIDIKPHVVKQRRIVKCEYKQIVIGVIGGISEIKGSSRVASLNRFLKTNNPNIKIKVIGDIVGPDTESVYRTGKYKNECLEDVVEKEGINCAFFSSVCPETYSFVVDEIISMGLPIVGFDIGAPPERILKYEFGKVVPLDSVNSEIINAIREVCIRKDCYIENSD